MSVRKLILLFCDPLFCAVKKGAFNTGQIILARDEPGFSVSQKLVSKTAPGTLVACTSSDVTLRLALTFAILMPSYKETAP